MSQAKRLAKEVTRLGEQLLTQNSEMQELLVFLALLIHKHEGDEVSLSIKALDEIADRKFNASRDGDTITLKLI